MLRLTTICSICLLSLLPYPVLADYYFNPHLIISDEEMEDYDAMTLSEVQRFLMEKTSGLSLRTLPDYQGTTKLASEIIWQASQESRINPKVLLTTLQKEQSLIESIWPSQNQLDKAMGYRCPDSGSCHPNGLGFGKQVDGAAWQFRQYLDNPTQWTYQAGKTADLDESTVTPVNQATAGLYNYTPHYSGNERFWRLWVKYWGKNHPDGSLLKADGDSGVWLIQYGLRRPITSYGVLLSRFDPKKIITVNKTDLEKWEVGPPIRFHNYSLLRLPDGSVYLLVDDELRHIASMEVFRLIGFNWDEVSEVADADLAGYQFGSEITSSSAYPTGALLQDRVTTGVYYVDNGIRYPLYSPEIMKANFPTKVISRVAPEQLQQYWLGLPLQFRDGELIKADSDSKVYVIADGERRWIPNEEIFDKLGYRWDNVIVTAAHAVNIHELGENVE